jgi:hypothetical protein
MALRGIALLVWLGSLAACANEYHPEYHPQSSYSYAQNISYPVTVLQNAGPASTYTPNLSSEARHVQILQGKHLDRPAEVVGVVDAHENVKNVDAALDTLRRRAAALGADAVVGVEFHHGESDEPTHLSGLAVRYLPVPK